MIELFRREIGQSFNDGKWEPIYEPEHMIVARVVAVVGVLLLAAIPVVMWLLT